MERKNLSATCAALTVAAFALASCAHEADNATAGTSTTVAGSAQVDSGPSTSASTAAGDAADSVQITQALGKISVPRDPKSVVAIGTPAVDNLISLGVTPTVVVLPEGEQHTPWNEPFITDSKVITITDPKNLPFEDIAATHPAFIVGDVWRVNKDNYTQLSAIAPALGAIGDSPDQRGWKAQILALGKIYGREDKAQEVIAADRQLFEQTAATMPTLAGKSGVICQYIGDANSFGVIAAPDAPANEFFTDLGMVVAPAIAHSPDKSSAGRMMLSLENISQLNADYMAIYPWGITEEALQQLPGWAELKQVKDRAVTIGSNQLMMGLNVPSALSRAWVLKQVTPQLEAAAKA